MWKYHSETHSFSDNVKPEYERAVQFVSVCPYWDQSAGVCAGCAGGSFAAMAIDYWGTLTVRGLCEQWFLSWLLLLFLMPKHAICASPTFLDFTSTQTTPSVIPSGCCTASAYRSLREQTGWAVFVSAWQLRVLLKKYSEEPWGVQAMPGRSPEMSCRFLKGPREQMLMALKRAPQLQWTLII